jgi:hypothetical protein
MGGLPGKRTTIWRRPPRSTSNFCPASGWCRRVIFTSAGVGVVK